MPEGIWKRAGTFSLPSASVNCLENMSREQGYSAGGLWEICVCEKPMKGFSESTDWGHTKPECLKMT